MPTRIVRKVLGQRNLQTTGTTVIYQVPDINTTAYIHFVNIFNNTAGGVTYSMWLNPNGSSTADTYLLAGTATIAARSSATLTLDGDTALILDKSGASLIVQAGTANALIVTAVGKEVIET